VCACFVFSQAIKKSYFFWSYFFFVGKPKKSEKKIMRKDN